MCYTHVFVAGTFDGLHAGHRTLFHEAFRVGERVTIGLTSDGFVAKFKSQIQISNFQTNPKSKIEKTIKSYREREDQLIAWLVKQEYSDRASIMPIDDPYEPAASMPDLDALIVTAENKKRGEEVNRQRSMRSLAPLTLFNVPLVRAHDGGLISSTRLRNREIDVNGRLVMPESLRPLLVKPLGKVLAGKAIDGSIRRNKDMLMITVGDVATKTLLDSGVAPYLAIIDRYVARRPYTDCYDAISKAAPSTWRQIEVQSGPGYISGEATRAIQAILAKQEKRMTHQRINAPASPARFAESRRAGGSSHHALVIDGEEDLLALPAIDHAPLGSVVYYGQPGQGLVEVVVRKEKKVEARALLAAFSQ